MSRVLYLTRNGLLEPLGQSQVLAYLRGLARSFPVTLISFEKPDDLADAAAMARARADCERHGIRWLPQRFRHATNPAAPALGTAQMFRVALGEIRAGEVGLVHARSYLPAWVALWLKRVTGTPFIFDMRALWPEELVGAGRVRQGSMTDRVLRGIERACLGEAAGIVSLTHAAVDHLHRIYPRELERQEIVVIPTCADLDRFVPGEWAPAPDRIYGCAGTVVSGWFRLDWLGALFRAAARRDGAARFEIITRDDAGLVRAAIGGGEELQRRLAVYPLAPAQMPEAVRRHSVSAMFFTQGLAKLGSSPTRMGEVLGSGVPVIANDAVGDVGRIVRERSVGVLMDDGSDAAAERALDALDHLLACPETPARCRSAAEDIFSLEAGTRAYRALYGRILGGADPSPEPARASVAATGGQD